MEERAWARQQMHGPLGYDSETIIKQVFVSGDVPVA